MPATTTRRPARDARDATALTLARVEQLIADHTRYRAPALQRLWDYYRNPLRPSSSSDPNPRLAQAVGLPNRIQQPPTGAQREQVIENDIAWRIHSLVDFTVGKAPVMQSLAADPSHAADPTHAADPSHAANPTRAAEATNLSDRIEAFLRDVIAFNGGPRLYQDIALLSAVYGHVDLVVRLDPTAPLPHQRIVIDVLEATRGIPVLADHDFRQLDAYLVHVKHVDHGATRTEPWVQRLRDRLRRAGQITYPTRQRTTIYTADEVRIYQDDPEATWANAPRRRLIDQYANPLGRLPVVHIQNLPQPYAYAGLSDVEPLIPLQDELNTRLSDRANRITFQAFKMYLGKNIEGFTDRPIGPGQMWSTDDPNASIHEFGGDHATPSEEQHIAEIRQAMDKTSGVPAAAAGLLTGKVGNLTSENALRLVFMGLLAKTEKKRVTLGQGLEQLAELILHAADITRLLPTTPQQRAVRIDWPNPLPVDEQRHLSNARMKLDLGVPQRQVLAELGYAITPT